MTHFYVAVNQFRAEIKLNNIFIFTLGQFNKLKKGIKVYQ